uniref:Sema domain-containing protein n=1 Tax=Oncorhynchus tshawytscha TaxID=74940 RepID=A0AAZ3SGQ5_ONCTS
KKKLSAIHCVFADFTVVFTEALLDFSSITPINNVVQDPRSGRVYLGAVNTIYQLDEALREEARTMTGPKEDARTCTPPVSTPYCQDTKPSPNVNKLLLVHPSNDSLIVCGSRYRGICSLLNLSNVEQQLYYSDSKGERTYVASIEDGVAVVAVMSTYINKDGNTFNVFLVGKGYGSLDSSKLISTRILQDYRDWVVFESIIEASTVQATPFVPKYLHDFRHAFKEEGFVYFLFSRTMGSTDNKNFTFVSRLCEDDPHYYSYTELQLNCGPGNRYNKVQAAYVASPGKELARGMTESGQYGKVLAWHKVLFMVASPDDDGADSALCMYPLNTINERLVDIISACYSDSGKIAGIPKDTLNNYKCGADFLPSPLASKPEFAQQAKAVIIRRGLLTAVAIAVENDHTIAFLGNSLGEVYKVHLTANPEVYSQVPGVTTGKRVNKKLFFDTSHSHLYITTEKKVQSSISVLYRPPDNCQSCVSPWDPYCGWCVLEGRCTRRSDCRRAEEKNGWLWSPKQQCVKIVSFNPPNLSCKKTQQVVLLLQEYYHGFTCFKKRLPPWCVCVCVRVCIRCLSCVASPWGCQWNTQDHTCRDKDDTVISICVQGARCPQFENPDPVLIPVGFKTTIGFEGINLDVYQVLEKKTMSYIAFSLDKSQETNVLFYVKDKQSGKKIDSTLNVTLYSCSLGREDCSLCKNADPKYRCVWCVKRKSCVYEKLCTNDQGTECPDPHITDIIPRYGPVGGGISVTIKGSNLGIHKEDIKAISVVGVPCIHQENKYAVSTSVFYLLILQDPIARSVHPANGSKAGGTVITISGFNLDTATREDIAVTVGGVIKFGNGEWVVGSVHYESNNEVPLFIIIPAVIIPMLLIILVSVYCYRRKSQQAEREYEKVKHQLENLEESVRDRCKKEFTDLMIEMEDHTNELSEGRIPFLDYKTYTDRVFFLPSKDGANDVMITGKLDIPEARKAIVGQALNQFSNLLNSKTFLINFIKTLEGRPDFNARAKVYFASLLTVALHGKLEYYTDIMRTLLLELMGNYVDSKNPKLMLRRSGPPLSLTVDSAGEPLYKLFRAIKHQTEKGPVDARVKKAKYTLNDTGLLGDDVEYCVLTLQVLVHGEGPDVTPVKVLNCDTVSQVKEKIIEAVYRNLPYSQRPKVDSVSLEWRPGSTGQILSDLDLTSQKEGRWRRINTLAHYNVRDNATLVLSIVLHTQQNYDQNQDNQEERNALLEDDKVFHLVRPDELDEMKSKRGSMKDKSMTKAITEIYLTRLLSVKGTLQQFVDDFFRSVLCSGSVVPPAIKYFFDFLDEQALKHDNVDEETVHIWKTNSLPLRFWVNILKNPHFTFDVHVTEVVDASLSVIAQTFMDACTKTEHKLSRDSPSNKLLYAKEISTYKKMVDDYYKGIRQMVSVSDQDMNTHLAEVSRTHTDKLNTQVALHQLYQYASKYYDGIIQSLDEDPAAQSKQLTLRLQRIAAALENKVTDL